MLKGPTTVEKAALTLLPFAGAAVLYLSLRLPGTKFGRWLDNRILRLSENDRSVRKVTVWIGIGWFLIAGFIYLIIGIWEWFG